MEQLNSYYIIGKKSFLFKYTEALYLTLSYDTPVVACIIMCHMLAHNNAIYVN